MILITGGLGFIGLHTARALLDAGESVTLTRFRRNELPRFLEGFAANRLSVIPLDVSNPTALAAAIKNRTISSIIHLATPPRTNLTAIEELSQSSSAFFGMMSAALDAGVSRITLASSVAVYFGQASGSGPFYETAPLPLAAGYPIEANKKSEEVMAAYIAKATGLEIIRARIAMIWGPLYHSLMNAPSQLVRIALGRADELAGRPDPLLAHPEDYHDYFYIRDCAAALAALHRSRSARSGAYNVSAGEATRYADLIDAINEAVPGARLKLRAVDRAPMSARSDFMANDSLVADTGFQPKYDLRSSVADYVRWLRSHRL